MTSAPRATYRLQLGPGFGFDEAAGVVGYLAELGVNDPVFEEPVGVPAGGAEGAIALDEAGAQRSLGRAQAVVVVALDVGGAMVRAALLLGEQGGEKAKLGDPPLRRRLGDMEGEEDRPFQLDERGLVELVEHRAQDDEFAHALSRQLSGLASSSSLANA